MPHGFVSDVPPADDTWRPAAPAAASSLCLTSSQPRSLWILASAAVVLPDAAVVLPDAAVVLPDAAVVLPDAVTDCSTFRS